MKLHDDNATVEELLEEYTKRHSSLNRSHAYLMDGTVFKRLENMQKRYAKRMREIALKGG